MGDHVMRLNTSCATLNAPSYSLDLATPKFLSTERLEKCGRRAQRTHIPSIGTGASDRRCHARDLHGVSSRGEDAKRRGILRVT